MLSSGYFIYGEYSPNGEDSTWKWECNEHEARDEGKLLETQFPIRLFPGAPEGVLKFGWLSAEPELPPQIEVLLQIAADAVETSGDVARPGARQVPLTANARRGITAVVTPSRRSVESHSLVMHALALP
jgi:hypothetical protein